ncbi:MAG: hypothetical protein RIR35_927, partial [Actinomycetota bacterium]
AHRHVIPRAFLHAFRELIDMLFRELTSKYQFSRRFIYRSGRHENLLPGRGDPVA